MIEPPQIYYLRNGKTVGLPQNRAYVWKISLANLPIINPTRFGLHLIRCRQRDLATSETSQGRYYYHQVRATLLLVNTMERATYTIAENPIILNYRVDQGCVEAGLCRACIALADLMLWRRDPLRKMLLKLSTREGNCKISWNLKAETKGTVCCNCRPPRVIDQLGA